MTFDISYPKLDGQINPLQLSVGDTLFILGANGTGKSRLMHCIYKANKSTAERISAHRQTFFESEGVELTPVAREETENHLRNWNLQDQAAWVERQPEIRPQIVLFDLVDAENKLAREIAAAVWDKRDNDARLIADSKQPPMKVISDLFKVCNIR